jgi:hypothetical protein
MSSVRSKVYFIVLTTLLVGGFPNFMSQEADAALVAATALTGASIVVSSGELTFTCTDPTFNAGESIEGRQLQIDDTDNTFASIVQTVGGAADAATLTCDGTTTNTITLVTAIRETSNQQHFLRLTVFDDGNIDSADSADTFTTLTIVATIATTPEPSNGSGCDDCEAPTLGINSKSKRIVENGFTYNGKSTDAERFFTPYPLISVTVGKQNTAVFKIFEDNGPENIKHFSFAFGLDKGQSIGESKAMIELDIDHEGTETVTITDPENALDNIKVTTNIENCNGEDSTTQCLIVTINHKFRAPLDFNIVGTDVWDMERNSWQNYFNHGIEVTGKSLNPAKEYDGINAGHIYHLTETSKNIALDEFGNSWSFQYGIWEQDYVVNERVADTSSVFTRNHSDFAEYKELQAQNSILQLLESCPSCLDSFTNFDDSFGYQYSNEINKLDNPEIIQKMILENERAQKIMNYLLDPVLKYK